MPKDSKKERFVKVCPRCGSRDFYTIGVSSLNYACKSCGFVGNLIEMSEKEAKKIKQKPARYFSPFPAPPSGSKNPGFIWRLLTILTILFLIYIWTIMIIGES